MARDACYWSVSETKRKDVTRPSGTLDFDLTTLFLQQSKLTTATPFPAQTLFENQQVGAAGTKDRLAAAKLLDDSQCGFCSQENESMSHFVVRAKL